MGRFKVKMHQNPFLAGALPCTSLEIGQLTSYLYNAPPDHRLRRGTYAPLPIPISLDAFGVRFYSVYSLYSSHLAIHHGPFSCHSSVPHSVPSIFSQVYAYGSMYTLSHKKRSQLSFGCNFVKYEQILMPFHCQIQKRTSHMMV